jgi:hypothetical protein
LVIAAWRGGYDIRRNTISDLGVTECGLFAHLGGEQIPVCSEQQRSQLLELLGPGHPRLSRKPCRHDG